MENKNYQKVSVGQEPIVELYDELNLTGAEISVNVLPAGANVPFVHSHKQNEEIYYITEGEGKVVIDGEEVFVKRDFIRILPRVKRKFFAFEKELKFICIQVKENSLQNYTLTDAVVY